MMKSRMKNRSKIRVFHFISRFDLGGAERVAANIAKSGNPDIEYHIVEILRGNSAFTQGFMNELKAAGVHCHRSLIPNFHFHFMAERIAAMLFPLRFFLIWIMYRPDVIHAHTETPDMCIWSSFHVFPWFRRRCKIVRTIHNTCLWTGLKRFGKKVERFYQFNNANIAISQSVLECYIREYDSAPPIIYNGVPEIKQEIFNGLDKGKTNILFAGRFDEQKGISHLIYIIKHLQNMQQYRFHVIGGGKLQAMIAQEIGCLPNVTLYGPVFGIAKYLASFDYMLMPSEFEGLPLMSVEASMAGLPVICSDCKGLNETVPSDWQLVAHGNSHDEYLNIFRNVLLHADRKKFSDEAKAFVKERFDVKKMQEEYEKVYKLCNVHVASEA